MTPTYEDVCKAFKTGWWSADANTQSIHIDNNLASLLNLTSNDYSYNDLLESVILTDKVLLESVLNTGTAYPLTNWNITLSLKEKTYQLEIIFELPKGEPENTLVLKGYARVSQINDRQLIIENPIKIGTPYCSVHNNIQTELQDNHIRLYGVCSIGIIHPLTWCLKRERLEIMSVANGALRNTEVALTEFINAIHPEDRDAFIEQTRLIANYTISSLTVRFRSTFLSKNYRWYEISANLMECHSLDKRFRCVGILHDIDDKKQNEEALNKSDNLLKSIYNNIPVGIELYNKEGYLIDTNQKDLDIFGMMKGADISKINVFTDPSLPADFKNTLKKGELTEASIDYNLDKIESQFGSGIIHLLTRGTPLYNAKNEIINYLLVHFDETESVTNTNRIKDFELFFSAIAEYAEIGYCKWDLVAKKGFALDQWYLNLGEDPRNGIESVVSSYNHLHPDDRVMMKNVIDEMRTGKTKYFKHEIRVKDGDTWKWLYKNVIVTKYAPEEGSIEAVSININITKYKEMEFGLTEAVKKAETLLCAQKKQERKIKELNNLMEAILNNIPVNIYVKDPSNDYKYLYWNEALSKIYGLKADQVIGKRDLEIFPKEMAESRLKANREQIEKNIEKIITENVVIDMHGEERIANSAQILIKTESELPLIMGVSWDITELKRYEEELIHAKNIAEESSHLKSAFLANMSHEIRTPLNAIVGFSELITDPNTEIEEKDEYMNIIRKNSQLLLQLISDILDLSKIEAHVIDFTYDTVNVNVLCNRIAMTNNIRNEAKVPILFDAALPDYLVFTDENRMQQVIVNFVNNAIKFTHEGEITIGYSLLNDNEIEIYVKDTGIGIPKDKLASIFERFVKLDSFVQGTGLGLSICQSIVEIMNGRIGVESEEGKGTRFWFTLPYDPNLKFIE